MRDTVIYCRDREQEQNATVPISAKINDHECTAGLERENTDGADI
jgi:hypothetical protein